VLSDLSADDMRTLEYAWPFWARPDQLPPEGLWRTWLLLGGRGSGKTRSAAEWVRSEVESGRRRSIGIIGPTADTLRRDVVQGQSGLLAICPPWCQPTYEPSQRRLVWPNGAVANLFSSEEPNRIRGPNLDGAWCDELTSWAAPEDCWSNLQFALRISGPKGTAPAAVVSTTPKSLLHNHRPEQIFSRYRPFSASTILYTVWCPTGKAFSNRLLTRIIHRTTRNRPKPPNTWARDFIAKNFIKQPIRIVVNDINGLVSTAHFS